MPANPKKSERTILLADEDVIVRLVIAQYLRACGLHVLEAATSKEAKAILQTLEPIDILLSDAQLAGPESGFALAQWVRRNRPGVEIMLHVSVTSKAAAAFELCCPPGANKNASSHTLTAKIEAMAAQRRRRARPQQSVKTAPRRKQN